jgi:hypothetical protein
MTTRIATPADREATAMPDSEAQLPLLAVFLLLPVFCLAQSSPAPEVQIRGEHHDDGFGYRAD